MGLKIVIVGGVAAGAGAAAKARRTDEQAEIVIFEKGPFVSFANCGLPYYVGDEIKDRKDLLVQTPESLWKRFRIKVHILHEALRIDRATKKVEVRDLTGGKTFLEPYDKLILCPGAGAIIPNLPGLPAANVFTLRTIPDSDAIKEWITRENPKQAVIIGAGFIGLEAAEAFSKRGLDVTLVEKLPQVLPPFDSEMADFMARQLQENGIHLILGDGLKSFRGSPAIDTVILESGREVPADLAILSIGVRPELKLARDASLVIGEAGGITVDEAQRTSDPDIYAAGDAVEVVQLVTGRKTRMPLAGPANKQGRVAGDNAAGGHLRLTGALGTAIVESMGLTAAKTGLSEREASQAGIPYYVSFTHSLDHAGYYPGGELMHMKLIVEKDAGRLLGAQIVGERGVDKRIDVLATALSGQMKVTDLENLDLAYAPQFSSAKDPVVMAGFAASNVARHEIATITCAQLQERLHQKEDLQLVDVRTSQEYQAGQLEGARLIPIDELRDRLGELDSQKETVVYCRVGFRGYLAARLLQQHGFGNVRNLTGGLLICPDPSVSATHPAPTNGKVTVAILHQVLGQPTVVAVDVREPDEYAYEHIVGTQPVPLGRLMESLSSLQKDKDLYVLCQTGVRTQQAIGMLRSQGYTRAHAVEGGLDAWKAAGFSVKRAAGPIPIMRQVQIAAGSLALIGGLLPHFHWIAIVVGAGLLFAGVSGTCGMAMVLARMPWNKSTPTGKDAGKNCGGSCA